MLARRLVVAFVAVTLGLTRRAPTGPAGPQGTLTLIDPSTNRPRLATRVPGYPQAVATTAGGIWMGDFREGVLWRYDPVTKLLQRISSNGEPRDIAAFGDDVYVAVDGNSILGSVARYDAATGARKDSLDMLACALAQGRDVGQKGLFAHDVSWEWQRRGGEMPTRERKSPQQESCRPLHPSQPSRRRVGCDQRYPAGV